MKGSDSDSEDNVSDGEEKLGGVNSRDSDNDDEDQEWARFQNKLNKREKALEGKSRLSHSVHCPYFTDDKQEFW